ncbi:MAG: hypothetical protein ABW139_08685 [Candidatus Thiodiazotropha sp. DIVDIV]
MTIKLNSNFSHHHAVNNRLLVRQTRVIRNEKSTRRISRKLEMISDEHGTNELITGINNSLSQHAYDSFNQQLSKSSLPDFLQDELRTTFKDHCSTPNTPSSVECQSGCDAICDEFLSHDITENIEQIPDIVSDCIDNDELLISNQISLAMKPNWSWHQTLSFIYEKIIFNNIQASSNEQVEKKTFNWLIVLSGSIAALQVQFLQAAMDNIKTMQENVTLPFQSQETLSAMSDDERSLYISERNGIRQRFITAKSNYQANIRLFGMVTQMLTSLFGLFSRPCRLRAN